MRLFHRILHGGSQERRRIFFRAHILTALCAFCVTLILYYLFLRCQTMELMIASTAALCVTIVLGALEPAKCLLCREKIKTRNSILLYFYRCPNCEFTAQRRPDGHQEDGEPWEEISTTFFEKRTWYIIICHAALAVLLIGYFIVIKTM